MKPEVYRRAGELYGLLRESLPTGVLIMNSDHASLREAVK